jgi:AraC-like DNA-binding protein
MPEPNRAPWLVEPELAAAPLARLIEQEAILALVCHACRHRATWTAGELQRRFGRSPTLTLRGLAPKLRCGVCRSQWVEILKHGRAPAGQARSP